MRFVLVDRIVGLEPGVRAAGIKNVTMSEDFLTYHFPENPVMPGMLILEAMIQLGSWLIAVSSDFKLKGILRHVERAKFKSLVRPGDKIELEVLITGTAEEQVFLSGKAKVEGSVSSIAEFSLNTRSMEIFEDPETVRRTFELLSSTQYKEMKKENETPT